MDFYVNISSDNSLDYFPNNSPSDFRLHLKQTLRLHGHWTVALTDIQYSIPSSKGKNIWVYSNICENTIVGDTLEPLLRKIPIAGKKGETRNKSFPIPYYKHVLPHEVESIQIYVYGDDKENISFKAFPLRCTLHFKKVRGPWLY